MTFSIHQLSLELGSRVILNRVSLEIEPGNVTAILGPNGAGKSSLLRAATGELRPKAGDITINGQALGIWVPHEKAQTVAVMPQHSRLEFGFTVKEVVLLGRIPHSSGWRRDAEIAHEALALVDASHLSDRLFTNLSGGERQRVQFARVLSQVWETSPFGPRYLLLDEPTASFDLAHQQMTLEVLQRFAHDNVGILIVLHDLNFAAKLAQTIVMLNQGCVVATGDPHHVLTRETIKDVFAVDALIGSHPRYHVPTVSL